MSQQATLNATDDELVVQVGDSVTGQVGFQLLAGLVGTVLFEATIDDATWVAILRREVGVDSTPTGTSTTTAGLFVVDAAGVLKVRARVNPFTSGPAVIHGIPHIG